MPGVISTKIHTFTSKWLILWRDTRDAYLMILSCLIFIFIGITAYISNAHASIHNESLVPANVTPGGTRSKIPPVYDVILNMFDHILKKIGWNPGLTYALVFTNFSVLMLTVRLVTLQRNTFWVMRRTFTVLSIVYGVRSLMVAVTVIPTPIPVCYYVIKDSLVETAIYNFLHGNESCGDVFFSGHTILFTMTLYLWITRPFASHTWISRIIIYTIAFLGYPSLFISKLHYTIDVLSGLWFTLSVIWLYRWLVVSDDLSGKWYSRALRAWDYPPSPEMRKRPSAVAIFNTSK